MFAQGYYNSTLVPNKLITTSYCTVVTTVYMYVHTSRLPRMPKSPARESVYTLEILYMLMWHSLVSNDQGITQQYHDPVCL